VAVPHETRTYFRDETGQVKSLIHPSVEEQYAAAFRAWGLDVDGTPEAETVERLGAEPAPIVQEMVAALDHWIMERRRRNRPVEEWRRLFRIAERLDRSERHGRLRALLVEPQPQAHVAAGLVGAGSPWLTTWELTRVSVWRELRE